MFGNPVRLNSIDEKLSQLVPEKEKADKNLRRKAGGK